MNDYDAVYTLWKSIKGVGLSEADTRDNIAKYIRRNPGMSFVAKEGEKVVGAALCGHDGRRGFIHHLAVAEPHRGKDIAKLLEIRCVNKLREEGIAKCHLFVFRGNIDAREFWHTVGWDERTDIVVMSKWIDGKKWS